MLKNLLTILLMFTVSGYIHANDCDFTDANFPTSPNPTPTACSFNTLGINPQELRFGNVNFGSLDGIDSTGPFVRLGSRLYQIDENAEVYDTREEDCDVDDDENIFDVNIAFILEEDSLKAPRIINKMWILNCDISTAR